jgi:hypothetical protein
MWKKERDLLIAQTLVFVQSVTGKAADAANRLEPLHEPLPSDRPIPVGRPAEILPAVRLSSVSHSELRDEVRRRVAAFRTRQQHFDRERTEYCDATLAKARAATELAARAQYQPPLKR